MLTLLLAPFVPFVTERVWSALFATTGSGDSVHLAAWPQADAARGRRRRSPRRSRWCAGWSSSGRSARADSKVKTRQPLSRALISAPGWATLSARARGPGARGAQRRASWRRWPTPDELVEVAVKPNFRELGRRFGKRTQAVADRRSSRPTSAAFVAAYRDGPRRWRSTARPVSIGGDEVVVTETPRSGWAVASAGPDTVALDLELTHELRLARPGPRRGAVRPGRPQERRVRGHRPHRAALAGRRLTRTGGGDPPARRAAGRGGAGHLGRRGRARRHRRATRSPRTTTSASRSGSAAPPPPSPS